jgi:hypothetical protein
MTALTYFQADYDRATRRILVNVNADAGYAILGSRDEYQNSATRRIWNFVGSNGISGYASYFGKNTDADSYATAMKTSYAISFEFRNNAVVLGLTNVPPRTDMPPQRYDTGLYDTLSRDSWAADFRSFTQTWLSTH